MEQLNEHNSAEYKKSFLKAVNMIDTRQSSHTANDVEIMSMLLDECEPYFEDGEEFSARFPFENMMLRMTWRRIGIIDKEYYHSAEIERHANGSEALAYDGWCDIGHTAPDWDNILNLGFSGLCKRLEDRLESDKISEKQFDYYSSGVKMYRAVFRYMMKMAKRADEKGKYEMAKALRDLTKRAPESLYEAMVVMTLYYDLQQSLECSPVRALNRIDSLFYLFYKKDIECGRLTPESAADLTDRFLRKLDSYRVPANVAFSMAGTRLDGSVCVNEYSYILLRSLTKLKLPFVKVHFLYDTNLPDDFMRIAFDGIRNGGNSIVFISDRATKKALMNIGVSEADADDYTVVGCYETCGKREIPCTCAGRINLAKALELTLSGGYDMITGKQIDELSETEFEGFDDLLEAFYLRLDSFADAVFDILDKRESHFPDIHSSPLFSSTMDDCVERGGDIYQDFYGVYNNTSINALGLATATDSLLAIKKLVFDDKIMTLDRLVEILRNNWEGEELLRLKIKRTFPKYGIGDAYADSIAKAMLERLAGRINGRPNVKGGVYRFGAFTVDWRFAFGEKCAASADGRVCGETLSKNISASLGADREGVTAHILSGSRLGGEITPNGSVLDTVLHSSAVQGENGLMAMLSTLKSFTEMGGTAIHYNVLNAETLCDAQKNPENYPNLQVRVCGWNALFSTLTETEQNEFIKQAEGLQ